MHAIPAIMSIMWDCSVSYPQTLASTAKVCAIPGLKAFWYDYHTCSCTWGKFHLCCADLPKLKDAWHDFHDAYDVELYIVPTSPITSRPIDAVEPYTMHNGKMVRHSDLIYCFIFGSILPTHFLCGMLGQIHCCLASAPNHRSSLPETQDLVRGFWDMLSLRAQVLSCTRVDAGKQLCAAVPNASAGLPARDPWLEHSHRAGCRQLACRHHVVCTHR